MKLILIMMSLSSMVCAGDLAKRPDSFSYRNSQAIFSDFTQAEYRITYDIPAKKASVEATINLTTFEDGHLVFDLHEEPTAISVNGIAVSSTLSSTPGHETTVRIINRPMLKGAHQLKVSLPLTQLVEFSESGVKSAFWMSDLNDRGYLERYLPTNFIYDRIPMTFFVKYVGAKQKQKVYANGEITTLSSGEVKVTYRGELNTTCQYFHTVPEGTFAEKAFKYRSIDGREIPSIIYLPKTRRNQRGALKRLRNKILTIMSELEKDYGPFPHPSLTVYLAGRGGMEYSGATMTSESALDHELFHSYFARGVMPSDGNSGWIDEALAKWRDNGYQRITSLKGTSQMANHGTYNRATDRLAYTFGERFMALLDGKLQNKGGLKIYLRELVEKKSFDPIDVNFLRTSMEKFYGVKLDGLFKRYLFGPSTQIVPSAPEQDNDIHRQQTIPELQKLL